MTVSFGIVGTGYMAAAILPSIRLGGARAYAVSSRDKARAENFASANGVAKTYGSAAEMFADPAVDAVYIASATACHAADAIAALEAGKHVLCEKPFAMNAAEGERVVAAAKASGKLFMEGLWTLLLPAYQRLCDVAREKSLGAPAHFAAAYGYPAPKEVRPRLYDKTDGGVLWDLGVYPASLALRLMGPAVSISSKVMRNADGVDTHFGAQLVHESGAVSQLSASFDGLMSNMATLACARGSATLAPPLFGAEEIVVETFEPGPPQLPGSGLKAKLKKNPLLRRVKRALGGGETLSYGADQYLPQMTHFLGLIASGKTESEVASHALSMQTVRLLDQIRAQG
jgi:predicted dehydrogenase